MANSIALAERYLPILDEIYKVESKTAILEGANSNIKFLGGNKVELFKTSMDGLGDYSRNNGFVNGSVVGTWEPHQLTQDRGRSFSVDVMDDEETLGQAFGTLVGQFMRTQVIPEIDAYRFAKLAGWSGISAATPANIVIGTTDVPALIADAEQIMNDNEVPEDGRILFVSELAYKGMKAEIARMVMNDDRGIQHAIDTFDGMVVVRVPQTRFNTAITLYDGSTPGEEDGGYIIPASTSYPINFMIVQPSAVIPAVKHVMPRIFSPEVNQSAEAWKFDYRVYHDIFVEANKVNGIYLHRASTANS